MIFGVRSPGRPSITTPDTGDFRTTQFPAPSIDTPRPQLGQGTNEVPRAPEPPPAPTQPPTTIEAPPPPLEPPVPQVAETVDGEARRRAEEERLRLAEEERREWERLRAGQLVQDQESLDGIMVFVRRDLDFSTFYPDSIKEALAEVRRERAAGRQREPVRVRIDKP